MPRGENAVMPEVATSVFRQGRGAYLAHVARYDAKARRMVRILALAMCLLAGVAAVMACLGDWRWSVIVMMVCMIVIPGVMMALYYSYALKPETFFNGVPHRLSVSDGRLKIHIQLPEDNGMEERIVEMPGERIRGYDVWADSVTLMAAGDGDAGEGWIWIPASALADTGLTLKEFLEKIFKENADTER